MKVVGVYLLMLAVSRAISLMINDSRPGIHAKRLAPAGVGDKRALSSRRPAEPASDLPGKSWGFFPTQTCPPPTITSHWLELQLCSANQLVQTCNAPRTRALIK